MAYSASHQNPSEVVSKDSNNNCDTKSYSLRPRLTQRTTEDEEPPDGRLLKTRGRTKRREDRQNYHPMSRYRRKTANARERSRMREINEAFGTLRRAIPQVTPTTTDVQGEKMTKISTLRLAMDYISALHKVLQNPEEVDILNGIAEDINKSSEEPGVHHLSSTLLPASSSSSSFKVQHNPLVEDFNGITLPPETDDQSFSSTSDIPDLFLVSLDFDASKASLPTVTSNERTTSQRLCGYGFQEESFVFDDELFLTNSR